MSALSAHSEALPTIARILLVCMFPFSAIDKVLRWPAALKQANSSWLPGGPLLLILAMIVEIVTPVFIVAGWRADIAALVLMGFCVATAVLYHPFWTPCDFWSKGDSVARGQFWDFTKNLGLAGGLLLVAIGAGFTGGSP
jgi:putative oxidoreductase